METQLRDLRSSVMKAERELDSSFRKLNPADEEKKARMWPRLTVYDIYDYNM